MTIAITRLALSAVDLRAAARRTRDAKVARRMIAIALVLEGWPREAAAEDGAMDRELCDWVHRYNELGLDGLFDRPSRNGPPPRLSAEQQALVAEWVEQRPEFAGRCGALALCRSAAAIVQEFAVQLQRAHGGQTAAHVGVPTAVGTSAAPRRFEWAYLFGAICSERSVGAAIVMPEVNVEAMNEHLAEIRRRVCVGAIALVLDGAGWHTSPRLNAVDMWQQRFIPACAGNT